MYGLFRHRLLVCGIPHAGRGRGPRVYALRHTFAVHTMLRWSPEEAELDAQLPRLATDLGQQQLAGTQRSLPLSVALFPELIARATTAFGDGMPRRTQP